MTDLNSLPTGDLPVGHLVEQGLSLGNAEVSGEDAAAVQELRDAAVLSAANADGMRLPALQGGDEEDESVAQNVRAARVRHDRNMARASKQRREGQKSLKRVQAGAATLPALVEIKDKVFASVLQRWFGAIDQCLANLSTRGEMLLGAKAVQLYEQLDQLISEYESEQERQLRGARELESSAMNEHGDASFVHPVVTSPAFQETIHIKSKLGLKLYRALQSADKCAELMTALDWNDVIEGSAREQFIYDAKRGFGKIYQLAARTNINLFNLVARRRSAGASSTKESLDASADRSGELADTVSA